MPRHFTYQCPEGDSEVVGDRHEPFRHTVTHFLDIATNVLKAGLNSIDSDDSDKYECTCFIIQQLRLLSVKKFGRNYSPQLTITAFLLHSASSAAYTFMTSE